MSVSQRCHRAAIFLLSAYTVLVVVVPWTFDLMQWVTESIPWLLSMPFANVTAGFNAVSKTVSALVPPPIRAGLDVLGLGFGLILLMLALVLGQPSIWLKLPALILGGYAISTIAGSVAQKFKMPLAFRTPEIIEFGLIFAAVVLFVAEVIRREWSAPAGSDAGRA